MPCDLELTVIIPTRNRAASLRETLSCLARADRGDAPMEVVVVDNDSRDETRDVVGSFGSTLAVSCLFEPRPGKGRALNRALHDRRPGRIVAVLDDDMSPHEDWVRGVLAISRRWPDHHFFTGRSYVIWPDGKIPDWARDAPYRGWAFSVMASELTQDRPVPPGSWVTGGHFWFRSSVLETVRSFAPIWLTEPWFMLQLQEAGYRGMIGPDAAAGHRIQPELLDVKTLRTRAAQTGRGYAGVRLRCRNVTKQGRLLDHHPALFHLFCVYSVFRWSAAYALGMCRPSARARVTRTLVALERVNNYAELLRSAGPVRRGWRSGRDAEPPDESYLP